jgi:hypothetical protein
LTRRALILACVALAACQTQARQGHLTGEQWPQAAEQCAAQPGLDWCKARAEAMHAR